MTKRTYHILCSMWILLILSGYSLASEEDHRQGLKALASNNCPDALHYLEAAVEGDPENAPFANDYRQASIRCKQFDRSLQFFQKEVADHKQSANLHLNYGFAYVDKIPVAGSITQVILANSALTEFSTAIELQPSWIAYYTRGESYLFWPKIFNRASSGVTDLEKAMEIQKKEALRSYHVKVFIALGDAYWKTDQLEKARAMWQAGLKVFSDNANLKSRLALQGDELKDVIEAQFDPSKRVNTDMRELWPN